MTVYGSNKVSQGTFTWRIKIISIELKDKWEAYPYIGIIEDSLDVMQSYKHRGSWQMYGCQLCAGNSGLWCKQQIDEADDNYQCQWRNDDDILEMILWKENYISRCIYVENQNY